ncbi:MAG: hypothetical protein IKR26_04490 [Lachnospiraceae bacterium]|nr:hypothetical protein [Lachnospiraceae bacterium]
MKAYEFIKREIDVNIEGITLLSIEEAEELPQTVRVCEESWWLRTPGDGSDCAAVVRSGGSVDYIGYDVYDCFAAVRPALKIANIKAYRPYEDKLEVFRINWIYIGDNLWLAEEPIFHSEFDEESNNYEKSEIKKELEDWLKKREIT